jgi:hypothetical protein
MRTYKIKRHQVTQPVDADYRLIPLTQGQNALVSLADFEYLSKFNWYARWESATKSFYAARKGEGLGKIVKMARELTAAVEGELVDHKNRNSLDNRRENLRKCTAFQNQCNHAAQANNTSGYKGVSPHGDKWRAQIRIKYRTIPLGVYSDIKHAAVAYNVAAMLLHKEFAFINEID